MTLFFIGRASYTWIMTLWGLFWHRAAIWKKLVFSVTKFRKLMWCSLLNMAPTSIKKRLTPISNNILAFQSPALSNVSFYKVVFLKVGIENCSTIQKVGLCILRDLQQQFQYVHILAHTRFELLLLWWCHFYWSVSKVSFVGTQKISLFPVKDHTKSKNAFTNWSSLKRRKERSSLDLFLSGFNGPSKHAVNTFN